ncbi:MAG TPA: hypothetical protein VFQ12_11315, partial [Thermoleophilaceae bacterium]|nr:hypothetical protein [Thermoleophilaceae bacterium]
MIGRARFAVLALSAWLLFPGTAAAQGGVEEVVAGAIEGAADPASHVTPAGADEASPASAPAVAPAASTERDVDPAG